MKNIKSELNDWGRPEYKRSDFGEIVRGKYDLDVVGHYARPDIFQLHVDERPMQPVTIQTTHSVTAESATHPTEPASPVTAAD